MLIKRFKSSFLILVVLLFAYCATKKNRESPLVQTKQLLVHQADSLDRALEELADAVGEGDSIVLKMRFLKTRKLFKKVEWFCEYYAPGVSKEINGPPL